jgi:hypothetical protein
MTSLQDPSLKPKESAWEALGKLERQTAIGLLVVAAAFCLVPILVGIKYRGEYLSVCLWGGALALVALLAGLWRFFAHPSKVSAADSSRLLILFVGGISGFLTVVFLGIGLAFKWWTTVTGGWEAWQGKEGWHVWVILTAFVGGLAIMFFSLQLARADERSNATFRKLLYGYNAVLTGLLLVLILVIVNILAYIPWGPFAWLNQTFNWSESSIYSLSSKSENILDALTKPVKVYVILSQNEQALYRPTHALMDNARAINKMIQAKYLSPDSEREEIEHLAKEYKVAIERQGLLVVYGTDPNYETRFIKAADLVSSEPDMMTGRTKPTFFKGESALMNELNSLEQGKEKPVIYLTQGNGELDMADSREDPRTREGLAAFKNRLGENNYTVKGLQFSSVEVPSKKPDLVVSKKVPADASLIIIAGPKTRFESFALDALKEYMNPPDPKTPKGKLIVMLGTVVSPEKTMLQTGLEPLLSEFGVEVKNDRLIRLPSGLVRDPNLVVVETNRDSTAPSQNPIVEAFKEIGFLFYKSRPVVPKPPAGPGAQQYRAETMMMARGLPDQPLIQEANLTSDPMQLMLELDKRNQLGERLLQEPVPVAVTVSESSPGAGADPHAFMNPGAGDSKPRLVVFGDGSIACNAHMSDRATGGYYYDLLASTIAWLREKPASIGIEPKKSDFYTWNPDVSIARMVLLPTILMVVVITGMGTGVWVVRRR